MLLEILCFIFIAVAIQKLYYFLKISILSEICFNFGVHVMNSISEIVTPSTYLPIYISAIF
jgi:hypothetical protein